MDVASRMAKVTAEYDLPFVPGLTLTGGNYFVGKQAADTINSVFLRDYTTQDVGLRYRSHIPTGQEVVFRLNISNITNLHYWATSYETGAPRTLAFSTQIKF